MAWEFNQKYEGFKMDASKIGNYIVEKWPAHEPTYMFGVKVCSSVSNNSPEIYGVFRIDWYDKALFKNNEYKSKLIPVGRLKDYMPNRAWYNSDIESSLKHFCAEYFEDPFEAQAYADKKNAEMYPHACELFGIPKKLNKFQKIIKAIFNI